MKLVDYDSKETWNEDKTAILSDEFYEYCKYPAEIIAGIYSLEDGSDGSTRIDNAWRFVAEKIRNNNFYGQLNNIVKCSVLTSQELNPELIQCIINSHQVVNLTPESLLNMCIEEDEWDAKDKELYEYLCKPQILNASENVQSCFNELVSNQPAYPLMRESHFDKLWDIYKNAQGYEQIVKADENQQSDKEHEIPSRRQALTSSFDKKRQQKPTPAPGEVTPSSSNTKNRGAQKGK